MSVFNVEEIVLGCSEGWESSYHSDHDCHWMCFTSETFVKLNHFFVNHHFSNNRCFKFSELCFGWQSPIEKKIACLHITWLFCKLLYFIATIKKFSLLTVDVADVRHTTGCAHKAWIICHQICFRQKRANVHHFLPKSILKNRQLQFILSDFENSFFEWFWFCWFDQWQILNPFYHKEFIYIITKRKIIHLCQHVILIKKK